MKNKLILTIILFLAIFNFTTVDARVADVSIKNIETINKVGMTEEISQVTSYGMNINYNLLFHKEKDSITYRVTIENRGSEDVYINNKGNIESSKYIVYDYKWDDNQNIIKGNSEKTFDLTITYNKPAEITKGSYEETKNLVIKISDQKGNNLPVKNPNTDSNLSIFIIILSLEILAMLGTAIYLIKNKKLNMKSIKQMKKANMATMGVFLILVLGTIIGYSYALEAAEIKVESKVKISKARLARSCNSDSYAKEETGYCLDWNVEVNSEKVYKNMPASVAATYQSTAAPYFALLTKDSKTMDRQMTYYHSTYYLLYTEDVSDLQNGEVMLGVYYTPDDIYDMLLVIGQDGGVLAPVDSSWLFASLPYEEDLEQFPKKELNTSKEIEPNVMQLTDTADVSKLDVSDTNNTSAMFAYIGYQYIDYQNINGLEKFNTSNVTDTSAMFYYALNGQHNINLNNWDVSKVTTMQAMFFYSLNDLSEFNISNWNVSNVENMRCMFESSLYNITAFDISNWDVSKVKQMDFMFYYGLDAVENFDISRWNTGNVINMEGMFAYSLNSIKELDLSNWDVSNVENMSIMFSEGLYNVEKINLSNWNPIKVNDISDMFNTAFENAISLEIYLNNFNLSRFSNESQYEYLFYGIPANENVFIYVGNEADKKWVNDLPENYLSNSITGSQIIIA